MARKKKGLLDELIDVAATAGGAKRSRGTRSGFRGRGRTGGLSLLVLVVLLLVGYLVKDRLSEPAPLPGGAFAVARCVDGDTLLLDDGSPKGLRVRLIGANTPETVKPNWPVEPYGPEASAFTKRVIAESDNRVRLAFDGDRTDKFGRTLALVYITRPEGEVMLNELLIREGLATADLQYNYSRATKNLFQRAEEEARAAKRNIWSDDNTGR